MTAFPVCQLMPELLQVPPAGCVNPSRRGLGVAPERAGSSNGMAL